WSVRVWDIATGKERAVLTGHKADIQRLAISPDGKLVASAGYERAVKLWDLGTSKLLATLTAGAQVSSVAISPDGTVLAAGTEAGGLELWEVATRKRRLTLPAHPGPTLALAYSPDGKMLASGCAWETKPGAASVKVWDMTAEPPRIASQVTTPALFAAFSP